jgi:AraC-like DNA-binding protein
LNPYYENSRIPLRAFTSRDTGFPLHLHAQLELFYVQEGTVEITAGPRTVLAGPGDLGVIFPHVVHSYATPPGGSRALAAMVGLEAAGGYYQALTQFRPDRPVLPAGLVHPDLAYCLQSLERELSAPSGERGGEASGTPNADACRAMVQLLLARLMPCLSLSPNPSGEREELTYQIIRYLAGHYREPVTLTQLAQELRVSRFHLSRVFADKLGMSFTGYLNNLRLELAVHLLRTSRLPVTQICAESGFSSLRTFNRVFRESYGRSPLRYRQESWREDPLSP